MTGWIDGRANYFCMAGNELCRNEPYSRRISSFLHNLLHQYAKICTQALYQNLRAELVRSTGLEPVRSPTRPSNVRVCLFRHDRMTIDIIHTPPGDVKQNFPGIPLFPVPCSLFPVPCSLSPPGRAPTPYSLQGDIIYLARKSERDS